MKDCLHFPFWCFGPYMPANHTVYKAVIPFLVPKSKDNCRLAFIGYPHLSNMQRNKRIYYCFTSDSFFSSLVLLFNYEHTKCSSYFSTSFSSFKMNYCQEAPIEFYEVCFDTLTKRNYCCRFYLLDLST